MCYSRSKRRSQLLLQNSVTVFGILGASGTEEKFKGSQVPDEGCGASDCTGDAYAM